MTIDNQTDVNNNSFAAVKRHDIKVLMIARSTIYTSPGGDTKQIEMTAHYLRKLDVKVDIELSNKRLNYDKYDLIHFFNIIRPDDILPHLKSSLPSVVSTIYVDFSEYDKTLRKGISGLILRCFNSNQIEYIKVIARAVFKGDSLQSLYYLFNGHSRSIYKIIKRAAFLLPNSNSEYNRFKNDFGIELPFAKVVNAIDPSVFNLEEVEENLKYKDHIICVGRIEGRKNQLNLIKALVNTEVQLTIIGKPALNQISYYNECLRVASTGSNIHFLDQTDHKTLASIYKAAKVHVLPSWFETTGLSTLEAAVMGCNIVITNKGDTEEYFMDMAYYCSPGNIESIRGAVIKAYMQPVNSSLRKYVLDNYTWEIAAMQTLEVYKKALARF